MDLKLNRIGVEDAKQLWEMQVEAFRELYEIYQDTETSPATEKMDKIICRLEQPFTYYYYIQVNDMTVGAVRVVDEKNYEKAKRISPLFVMPQYRNQGIAQQAIREAEKIHGSSNWEMDTILQEKGIVICMRKWGIPRQGRQR